MRFKTICIFICLYLLSSFVFSSEDVHDVLLCRHCGHEISFGSDLRNINSPLAISARNETVVGVSNVLVQLMENFDGDMYEIVTTVQAEALVFGDWSEEYTWFPKFHWKAGICPHCGVQLGWVFNRNLDEPKDDADVFMALILYQVISRNFADSLLVVPNLYR